MQMNDLYSVVITTHKGSRYIERAVRSVQNQTYTNIEIIVVDDNGLGAEEQILTEQKVRAMMETDPRISYYAHETNKNGSAARNTGAKHAKGAVISLLDDDDEYLPNRIASAAAAFRSLDSEWGMVYCANTSRIRRKKKSGNLLFPLMLHTVVIGSSSLSVRRELWEKLGGFDESFRRHQDFEFTARAAAITQIRGLDEPGMIYHADVGRNKPKNIPQMQEHRAHYLNKMMPLIRTFSPFRQKIIICSNSMQVTSPYLKGGHVLKFLRELKAYMAQWEPKCGIHIIACVGVMKIYDKVMRRIR